MNKLVSYIVFFFNALLICAQQNLVPNPSFEEYNWCPNTTDGFYINACKYWTSPTLGSPDYFNACSTEIGPDGYEIYSVPQNYVGFQYAHSGLSYSYILFSQGGIGALTYAEYIQVKLLNSLESGKFYKIRFFLHNTTSDYSPNSIGALLTNSEMNLNTDERINLAPQVKNDSSIFFTDPSLWYEVSGIFQAHGGESYLTIGVFEKLPEIKVLDNNGDLIVENGVMASYFIDDVSLIETEFQVTNVFTPDGDGVNDSYYLSLESIGATGAVIVNRWGDVVASGTTMLNWDGTFKGNECSEGVYFVRIQFENNETSGFIHLVR